MRFSSLFRLHLLRDISIHDFLAGFMLQLLLRSFTQTVVDHAVHIAGAALIQILFSNFAVAIITANLQLIHAVLAAGKHVLHEPARSHVSASSIHLPVDLERLYGFFSVFPLFQADAGMPSMPSYHQTIFDMP